MNWKRLISALLLAMCILCALPRTAYAHETPDPAMDGNSTITVTMEYDGKPVKDGTLTLYRVGEVSQYDGNYFFTNTTKMQAFEKDFASLSSDELSDPNLAEEVAAFVKDNKIESHATAKVESGTAMFSDLKLGLYLIVQTKASTGFEPISPFLVTVPYNRNGTYIYEVTADSKMGLHQEPTPTAPLDGSAAQTGQLNWPVPVLAALGLGLILLGLALRSGKKGSTDEA